jgi:hypothetical protein
MRTLAAALLALAAASSFADQPSRESEAQPLYVLRAYVFPNAPAAYQGIFRYDPVSQTYTPFVPFFYNARFGDLGATRLAATADRIIVQSSAYFEFDLTTGRLLRRYDGSDAARDGYAFHGVVVTDEQAKTLGIASGIYGFPLCIYYFLADPVSSTCPQRQFPGYAAPTLTPSSVLLRRSLDPADPTLTVVKVIGSQPSIAQRPAVTLDVPHHQFWTWGAAAGQWATLPISGGTVGDAVPTTVGTPSTISAVAGLTVHEPSQTLFDVVEQPDLLRQFLKQPTSNAMSVSTIDTIFPSNLSQPRVDSVTAIPAALPERYVQMIPAVGELHGLNGTFWRSDVWLYNPSDAGADVTIRRVVRPESTSTQHLAAHGSVVLRNVLSTLGGGSAGDGVTLDALVIDAPYRRGAQLSAYSRTFTDASDGGTYGQAVPAVPSTVGYSTHPIPNAPESYLQTNTGGPGSSFVIDQRQPGRFRHNLGVVNDSAKPLDVSLDYATKKTVSVAPHSVTTINIESLFAGAAAPVVFVEAERAAPVWMSVVDNISQDATFVPFEIFPLASDSSTEMAIPAVAATAGANGTSWRTDLFGNLPKAALGTQTLATTHFDAASGCSADASLPANTLAVYSDVARQFGPCGTSGSGLGALRLAGTTWMAGYSRTYNTGPDGGTFGDMLPFYPAGGWPLQHFSGIETGARFRINVGLYNGQSATTSNRLLLYDANGALAAQRDVDLASHASLQAPIASLMNVANLPAGLYGLSVIPLGTGRSWAYVSLVDNVTGDPTNLW